LAAPDVMKFTCFSKLPVELQDRIWELAADVPQAWYVDLWDPNFRRVNDEDEYDEDTDIRMFYELRMTGPPQTFGDVDENYGLDSLDENADEDDRRSREEELETADIGNFGALGGESPRLGLHLACRASHQAVRRYEAKLKLGDPINYIALDIGFNDFRADADNDLFVLDPYWTRSFTRDLLDEMPDVCHPQQGLDRVKNLAVPWISLSKLVMFVGKPSYYATEVDPLQYAVDCLTYLVAEVACNAEQIFIVVDGLDDDDPYESIRDDITMEERTKPKAAWERDFYATGREYYYCDVSGGGGPEEFIQAYCKNWDESEIEGEPSIQGLTWKRKYAFDRQEQEKEWDSHLDY
jgi:hypothetical protein